MYSLVACCRSSNGTINHVSVEKVEEIVISIEMRNQNGVVLQTREGSYLKKVLLNGIYILFNGVHNLMYVRFFSGEIIYFLIF
jgi:hypothetical protein